VAAEVQGFRRCPKCLYVETKDLRAVLPYSANFRWPFSNFLILGEDDPAVSTSIPNPGRIIDVLTIVWIDVGHCVDSKAESPQGVGDLFS
jgi:hypothetical protein